MEEIHGKTDIKVDDQWYFLDFEGNLKFKDVVGPHSLDNMTRKEFLVRLDDVFGFLPREDKSLKKIQKESGATIVIISSPKVKFDRQVRIELWGTADQVKIAESGIVREITKLYTYRKPFLRPILRQAPIYHEQVYVPVYQSAKLIGISRENVVKMEAESGAWILVDPHEIPSPRRYSMIRLNIFGNRDQVYRALMIVNEAVLEPYKPVDNEPSGTVQGADEQTIDRVKVGKSSMEADKINLELVDDEAPKVELQNEFADYGVFLKKLHTVKPMKTRSWSLKSLDLKWPTPQSYRPTSPSYILTTSHADTPSIPYDPKPPSYNYSPTLYSCPTPPSYSPTSPAYMFTSHVYIPTASNPYNPK